VGWDGRVGMQQSGLRYVRASGGLGDSVDSTGGGVVAGPLA